MKTKYSPGFMAGWMTLLCWNEAVMDLAGKEKYIETVRVAWVDTKWWYWPLLLIGFILLEMIAQRVTADDKKTGPFVEVRPGVFMGSKR